MERKVRLNIEGVTNFSFESSKVRNDTRGEF